MEIKFVVDNNVGKLARWLRMMGYDSLLFREEDDGKMINIALAEDRVILTKDTQIMRRRVITKGRLKAIFIGSDDTKAQLQQVAEGLNLDYEFRPFSICLECNQPLLARSKEEVKSLVPPFVFQTQEQYMECLNCHRIYWRGTHWLAMNKALRELKGEIVK